MFLRRVSQQVVFTQRAIAFRCYSKSDSKGLEKAKKKAPTTVSIVDKKPSAKVKQERAARQKHTEQLHHTLAQNRLNQPLPTNKPPMEAGFRHAMIPTHSATKR